MVSLKIILSKATSREKTSSKREEISILDPKQFDLRSGVLESFGTGSDPKCYDIFWNLKNLKIYDQKHINLLHITDIIVD